MPETEHITAVVTALGKVPAKSLRLIELTQQATKKNGRIDYDMLANMQPEVNLAVVEAQAYSEGTQVALAALLGLEATPCGTP